MILNNQAADTSVVEQTRSPTWNCTLLFHDLVIYGDINFVLKNPPTIIVEFFDYDEVIFFSWYFLQVIMKLKIME